MIILGNNNPTNWGASNNVPEIVNQRLLARRITSADRDIVALGIAFASAILLIGTGSSVMPKIVRSWMGIGDAPDMLLINALLLNIALLIFGWRRYADLQKEVEVRRIAEARARALAETDPLTGCLNRRSGLPAIEHLRQTAREQHQELALLMLDLDNFKSINDLNGHRVGDQVLVTTAARIIELLPPGGLLARIGGDEFLCALTYEPLDRERIDSLAASMVAAIAAPIEIKTIRVEARVSVGIASTEIGLSAKESLDGEALAHRADIAMYHAKKRGRNRHFWFDPQMEGELSFRSELETGIRLGIPAGEFVPYYEQQIDLESGDLVGFEMLARWHSPRFGVVSPEVFIPISEDMDVIAELSEGLIRQALVDAKAWHPSLTLSVNISPIQLRDPWFAQKILQLLVESGFPPHRLEIEITESCLHENIGAVRAIVTSLKNQGIRLSLDDFGTGYSSLAQLRALPFDRLKIDRSFVSELMLGESNTGLVEAIISLGRGLDLPVTAEGVESAEVLAMLRGMGHLKGQGFFYGRPEDAGTTHTRLASMNLLVDSVVQVAAAKPQSAGKVQRKVG